MASYKSLVGGFYSSNPADKNVPVSIRMNNPGAVNGAPWERNMPGYVGEVETTPGNHSTIFETPEQGVAVWYELMRKYRAAGVTAVGGIITRYGGGQDYSKYAAQIETWTGFPASKEIKLVGDDKTLLAFAKAMFRYEAGRLIPWSDTQILYGFNLARGTQTLSTTPTPTAATQPVLTPSFWDGVIKFLRSVFGTQMATTSRTQVGEGRDLKLGDIGNDVAVLQRRLRELGYSDLVVDGEFGEVTEQAVRKFQVARNIDVDGEVGALTRTEFNRSDAHLVKPPLLPPAAKYGPPPPWYNVAQGDIGFHEVGENRGIEKFIADAKCGQLGDPYCAIGVNHDFEKSGIMGSRSAAARSFERSSAFKKLDVPALGAVVTNWRGSPSSGLGHVFLYDGENESGVRGIGYNEDDRVQRSFHPRARIVGYYWPTDPKAPQPRMGKIIVSGTGTGAAAAGSET